MRRLQRQRGALKVTPVDAVNAIAILFNPQGDPVRGKAETHVNHYSQLATVGRSYDCAD